jgi:hypothetical protein
LLLGLNDEGFAIPDDPEVLHAVSPASVSLVGKNAATVGGDVTPYMTVGAMVSRGLTGSRSDAILPTRPRTTRVGRRHRAINEP